MGEHTDPIPAEIARLLVHVHSVLELELLLFLHEVPDQEWSPESIARILNGDLARTRTALVNLSRAGLLDRLYGGESLCFRFNEQSSRARQVGELAALYLKSRARIVSMIEARSPSSLQEFSDSFRLREEDE